MLAEAGWTRDSANSHSKRKDMRITFYNVVQCISLEPSRAELIQRMLDFAEVCMGQ